MSNYANENGTGLEQQVSSNLKLPTIVEVKIRHTKISEKCMSQAYEKIKYGSESLAKIDVICVNAAENLFLALSRASRALYKSLDKFFATSRPIYAHLDCWSGLERA